MKIDAERLAGDEFTYLYAIVFLKSHVVKSVLWDVDCGIERLVAEVGYYQYCILAVRTHEGVLLVGIE